MQPLTPVNQMLVQISDQQMKMSDKVVKMDVGAKINKQANVVREEMLGQSGSVDTHV